MPTLIAGTLAWLLLATSGVASWYAIIGATPRDPAAVHSVTLVSRDAPPAEHRAAPAEVPIWDELALATASTAGSHDALVPELWLPAVLDPIWSEPISIQTAALPVTPAPAVVPPPAPKPQPAPTGFLIAASASGEAPPQPVAGTTVSSASGSDGDDAVTPDGTTIPPFTVEDEPFRGENDRGQPGYELIQPPFIERPWRETEPWREVASRVRELPSITTSSGTPGEDGAAPSVNKPSPAGSDNPPDQQESGGKSFKSGKGHADKVKADQEKAGKADKESKAGKETKADKESKAGKENKADKESKAGKENKADRETKAGKESKADKESKAGKETKAGKADKKGKDSGGKDGGKDGGHDKK